MTASPDERPKAAGTLLILAALMALGYLCIRTLRFTNDFLNVAFVCSFLLIPLLAVRPMLRLGGWPKLVTAILLAPLLVLSLLFLLFTVSCDVPAVIEHLELSRELAYIQQGRYTVHLLWERSAGGAIGSHGVVLEQRMSILPGLYVVKDLDYFEGAHEGSLSTDAAEKVMLHIPQYGMHQEVDRVYSLKPRVYF